MTSRENTIDKITKQSERGRYILFAEGDANNLFYTSMLLQRFNYFISMATTGREALEMVAVSVPSLVIVAATLTDMSGIDFIRELQKNVRTRDIPFIGITSEYDILSTRHFLDLGAADSFHHPLAPEDLYQAVQKCMERTPRRHIRIRATLPVKVNNMHSDYPGGICTTSLSERGMFVRMNGTCDVDTKLNIEIQLKDRPIAVEAKVIYSYRTNDGSDHEPGIGLEFVKIAAQDQNLIRQFIQDKFLSDVGPMNS